MLQDVPEPDGVFAGNLFPSEVWEKVAKVDGEPVVGFWIPQLADLIEKRWIGYHGGGEYLVVKPEHPKKREEQTKDFCIPLPVAECNSEEAEYHIGNDLNILIRSTAWW